MSTQDTRAPQGALSLRERRENFCDENPTVWASTLWPESKAHEIAARNSAGALVEPEAERWTYTVAARGRYFIVEVRDETGFLVGTI